MASSENIPTKVDVSVIVGKVWLQFSARCYINDYFDSATNNLDVLLIFTHALVVALVLHAP